MRSWDIFCKVVDNFGDAGVCWRLARQLASEHGGAVRLWIDDVSTLARIWPGVDPRAEGQYCAGIELRRWTDRAPSAADTPNDIVIEAFACETPPVFLEAMAARHPQTVWLNLEYLSAEPWVNDCHLLPSPHPRLPLVKRFFFPGFTDHTGGLLRERDLLARRDAFQRDEDAMREWWRALGIEAPDSAAIKVSLFAYPNPATAALFDAWSSGDAEIFCAVPEGVLREDIARFFGGAYPQGATATRRARRGKLTLAIVPFLRQTDYDQLLWSCDLNFVRGEDSFVRAQWAARPLVWHIYPQADDAHRPKLRAFAYRYGAALPDAASAAMRGLQEAWNGTGEIAMAWPAAAAQLAAWTYGADRWSDALAAHRDLASGLAETAENLL